PASNHPKDSSVHAVMQNVAGGSAAPSTRCLRRPSWDSPMRKNGTHTTRPEPMRMRVNKLFVTRPRPDPPGAPLVDDPLRTEPAETLPANNRPQNPQGPTRQTW